MSDFQVVNVDPTTGLVSLGIPTVPKILTGMDKLIQIVVLSYLSNPGQNVFDPNEGSGLRAAIGQYNFTDSDEPKLLFVQRTKAVEQEILTRQSPNQGELTEKLRKLTVLDVAFDTATAQLAGRVQIINQAGDSIDVVV